MKENYVANSFKGLYPENQDDVREIYFEWLDINRIVDPKLQFEAHQDLRNRFPGVLPSELHLDAENQRWKPKYGNENERIVKVENNPNDYRTRIYTETYKIIPTGTYEDMYYSNYDKNFYDNQKKLAIQKEQLMYQTSNYYDERSQYTDVQKKAIENRESIESKFIVNHNPMNNMKLQPDYYLGKKTDYKLEEHNQNHVYVKEKKCECKTQDNLSVEQNDSEHKSSIKNFFRPFTKNKEEIEHEELNSSPSSFAFEQVQSTPSNETLINNAPITTNPVIETPVIETPIIETPLFQQTHTQNLNENFYFPKKEEVHISKHIPIAAPQKEFLREDTLLIKESINSSFNNEEIERIARESASKVWTSEPLEQILEELKREVENVANTKDTSKMNTSTNKMIVKPKMALA
ncbi:MAG: hypothetical protein ACRC4L_03205 [Mycoplasma sp.]